MNIGTYISSYISILMNNQDLYNIIQDQFQYLEIF